MYKQTDHYYYRKFDNDGNYRQTKVSMGTGEISKNLWRHILNRQLQVTKEYFNEKI
ncbi:MAG: type II toxin-antitoxin system HicA family toxin [Oscillospiraceae bacterium]|nr:type II toxin-antitoxin system HicA family toxin [Oscillospiraceae bacterium]